VENQGSKVKVGTFQLQR